MEEWFAQLGDLMIGLLILGIFSGVIPIIIVMVLYNLVKAVKGEGEGMTEEDIKENNRNIEEMERKALRQRLYDDD